MGDLRVKVKLLGDNKSLKGMLLQSGKAVTSFASQGAKAGGVVAGGMRTVGQYIASYTLPNMGRLATATQTVGSYGLKAGAGLAKGMVTAERAMTSTLPVLAALTAGLLTVKQAFSVQQEMDVLNAGLLTITQSTTAAATVFDELNQIAAETPYTLDQSVEGFTKLVNLGLTPSRDALISYGNTAAALGKDLNQMVEAVADAATGEFERLKEFGIKAKQNRDEVAFTFQGTTTVIGNNAAEIEKYLQGIGNNQFAGSMSRRMDTLNGDVSNLGQTWQNTFNIINNQGANNVFRDIVQTMTAGLQELNVMLGSGQVGAYLDATGVAFSGFAQDADLALSYVSDLFETSSGSWLDSISSLPQRIRAYIQEVTVETIAGIQRLVVRAEAFKDRIAAIFNDDTAESVRQRELDQLAIIESVRASSIAAIHKERDATIQATQDKVSAADALRSQYEQQQAERDKNHESVLSQYKVEQDAQQESLKKLSTWYSEYKDQVDPARVAQEEFNTTISNLDALLNSTDLTIKIDQAEYDKAVESAKNIRDKAIKDSQEKTRKELDTISELYLETAKRIDSVFADAWKNMGDGFEGVVKGIGAAFEDMLAEMAHQAITRPITLSIQQSISPGSVTGPIPAVDPTSAAVAVGALAVKSAIDSHNRADEKRMEKFTAEYRQRTQNTGTVLGDLSAQSHSVRNLTQHIADISTDALSINKDMLDSLRKIEISLTKSAQQAARQLTRTGGLESFDPTTTTSALGDIAGAGIGWMATLFGADAGRFANAISSGLYNSKTKLQDAGIQFNDQTLGEILRAGSVDASAYQQIRTTKSYGFGAVKSSSSRTHYESLDAEVREQLGQAFINARDIFDTFNDELGLGLGQTINNLKLDASKLSLKGLSPDELAETLESFLSTSLDKMTGQFLEAGNLVDFINQYQQVGEGQLQTLGRVVAESRQWQQTTVNLGLQFNATGVEAARLTQQMAETAGGFNNLQALTESYYDKFYSQAEKQALLQDQLTGAFEKLGVQLPESRKAFRDMVSALDLTTESGQQQYAQYIQLSPVLDRYLSGLETQENQLKKLGGELAKNRASWLDHFTDLADWGEQEQSRIRNSYQERIRLAGQTEQVIQSLGDWMVNLQLGDLSIRSQSERLELARAEYEETLNKARSGDLEAAAALKDAAQRYLQSADEFYGRNDEYQEIFRSVIAATEGVTDTLSAGASVEQMTREMNEELTRVKDAINDQLNVARAQADHARSSLEVLQALPDELAKKLASILGVELPSSATPAPTLDGSHAKGLGYVPFDGYRAELHRGEMVLPAALSAHIRNAAGGTLSQELIKEVQQLRSELNALRSEQSQANKAAAVQRDDALLSSERIERSVTPGVEVNV